MVLCQKIAQNDNLYYSLNGGLYIIQRASLMKNSPFVLLLVLISLVYLAPATRLSAQSGACFASPIGSNNINTRGGPGTEYARVDTLAIGAQIMITGQRTGVDGFVWWRTFSGGWVRSDVVGLFGNCDAISNVALPPAYCTTRTELSQRPVLSGEELRIGTSRFVVHYTLTGIDATTTEIAKIAADTLEESLSIQVDDMGWPLPPPDCGEGGDERFDLYIHALEQGIIGFAIPNHIVGDNPYSIAVEQYAAYGHLEITNGFEQFTSTPIELMKTTIAHEVHHNIQHTFDFGDSFRGLDEAGATWIETQVYPQYQDAMQYLDDYLYYPDLCLGYNGDDHPLRIYGEWLLIDSLVRDYGAHRLHEVFWRYRADYEGMESFYLALESLGDDASNAIFRMGVRNLLRLFTQSSEAMERVYVEGIINGIGDYRPRRDGVQELGIDYMKIADLGKYHYEIWGGNLFMSIVGIRGAQADILYVGTAGTVDLSHYEDAYLMILSLNRRTDDDPCLYDNWKISVTEGVFSAITPHDEVWDATFFEPPVQFTGIERYIGRMDESNDEAEYRLFLKAGDVLNVYAGTLAGNLDTYLILTNVEETEFYIEDDDGGGGFNSYFSYVVPTDGEYILIVTPIGVLDADSDFEVIIGINQAIR